MKKYDEVVVEVKDILKEAVCRGESEDGVVVFTRYAIPSEIVKVKIFRIENNFYYGDLVEVLKPSYLRISPVCKYFGNCGGCDLQMLPYEEQLKYKRQLVTSEFKSIPEFDQKIVSETIPSPMRYNYRNSVMFRVDPKRKKIGFLKRDTNIVVDIDKCEISSPEINYALSEIKRQENFPQHIFKVRSNSKGEIVVNQIQTEKFHDKEIFEEIEALGMRFVFRISRESFFQVNTSVIPIWLEKITELIGDSKGGICYDLYCGGGIISIFVSRIFERVIGVEVSKTSYEDGIFNVKANNIGNVQLILGDVSKVISSLDPPDVMIVNPSRLGIEKSVIDYILRMLTKSGKPKKIIYSSCNYETMVRDIKLFVEGGYKLKSVIPIDMFPQTHHVEVLALLIHE